MTVGRYHPPMEVPMAGKDVVVSQTARQRIAHGLDVLANDATSVDATGL